MATAPRRPKAVRMDDESVIIAPPPPIEVEENLHLETDAEPGTLAPPAEPKSGFSWFGGISAVLGTILSLAFGLWMDQLIRDLFDRAPALGWIGIGLAGLLGLLVLGFIWREVAGIRRQAQVDGLRKKAEKVKETDSRPEGLAVIDALHRLFSNRPDTARGRARLEDLRHDIIDGAALIGLAETHLLSPLDRQAIQLVTDAAKRVSIVTAVSPRAIVDVGYVLFESIRLIRTTSQLYAGRPGLFGFLRLTRSVIAHLAVTGGVALGDSMLQQILGMGLASRVSARLGEGMLNGFLTARIGLSALDLCRPLPFSESSQPTLSQVMGSIISINGDKENEK